MNGVRLLTKDGGKRGHWTRDTPNAQTAPAHTFTSARSATVLVASTGGANGTRPDTTGPTIATWLRERRSEEHTSELQSLMRISYAVFCLQKKNKKYTDT